MQETTNLQKTMSIQACTERVQKIVAVSYPCAKAYVHSFGCQLNVSDGEKIKGLLQSMGFSLTETHEDADVIVFNTCAVRESAEDRVYGMLGVMKKYKETHPRTILILSGCMGSEPKTLEKVRAHYSFIDILMGTASIGELPRLLATYYDTKKFVYDMDSTAMPSEQMQQVRNSGFKASVPIMYGCNNFCTYCIVPYVRGTQSAAGSDSARSPALDSGRIQGNHAAGAERQLLRKRFGTADFLCRIAAENQRHGG